MSIEIPMRREGSHLVPADAVAAEMISEVPVNTGVMVTVKVPRNLRQFRLAWALADIVSKSVDWLHDRESAMDWLKIKARHVRMIQDPLRGTVAIVPKSISFASLDQAGFARVLNRMVYVTITEIIPGMNESNLRAELEAIVGIEPASAPSEQKPPRAPRQRKAASAEPQPQEPAGGTAGNTNPAAPSTSPQEDTAAGSRPQNEAEYIKACQTWLKKQTDRHKAFDYFNGEVHRQMRMDLKVSTGSRKMLERQIGEFFDERDKNAKATG